MKITNLSIPLGIVALLTAVAFAAEIGATGTSPPAQTDAQDDVDDNSDDWVFDAGPYTSSPKTGKRVWQYAKPKPAIRDAYSPAWFGPESYWFAPRYFGSDPFFQPQTDSAFFLNTPDPFYAEPIGYPFYYGGGYEWNPYNYY